ncbi:DUF6221 family protein [Streptomyces sp. NPDC090798]|uniref:DUF6221 family protein n=1 Tax=Streptomyces sp. NPDC090798 TaxID=3365968 RepID=UPI00382D84C8
MDDLVQWLGGQLDVDEQIAREATPGPWRNAPTARHHATASGRSEEAVFGAPPELGATIVATTGEAVDRRHLVDAEHIARHDPARVLREIDAKRAIVARYEFACREASRVDIAEDERETWIRVGGALQSVVIQLAAPYAGRPGFKAEEWAP